MQFTLQNAIDLGDTDAVVECLQLRFGGCFWTHFEGHQPPGDVRCGWKVDDLGMIGNHWSAAHLRFTLSCNACFHFYSLLIRPVLSED